jgi:hypothetical protein
MNSFEKNIMMMNDKDNISTLLMVTIQNIYDEDDDVGHDNKIK